MTMLLVLALVQLPMAQNFPEIDHPGANGAIAATVEKLCPSPFPGDRGALLRVEQRLSDSVVRKPTATGLTALGCIRSNLYEAGAVAHEGYLIPSGASWSEAATLTFRQAVALHAAEPKAAELLMVLALEQPEPPHTPELLEAAHQSIVAGMATPGVLRGCTELAVRMKDAGRARECATMALTRGVDSSWHLVRLAQLSFREADTVSGLRWFQRAAGAAHDSVSLRDLDWHMQWFLTPPERTAWDNLADSLRGRWLREHLAERDVRDGQPFGARLAEHFSRLEYVMDHFRLRVNRATRERSRTGPNSDPEATMDNDMKVLSSCEPGMVKATPFRFYKRWQTDIDDRGVVWMRFGPPTKRIPASPSCMNGGLPTNQREAWLYELDGERMLLSFEQEMFSGSVEATRLVGGVLGSYFCDVDTRRCNMSALATSGSFTSAAHATAPQGALLHPEDITKLHTEDAEYISAATTRDDNSPRGERNIQVLSKLHRLWDPLSGASLALVTFALPVHDLSIQESPGKRTTLVDFELRQWDATADQWRDTSFSHHFAVPDSNLKRPTLVGFTVAASTAGVSSWSLVARQSDQRRGRIFDVTTTGLPAGPVVLSDLVIGSEPQGITWNLHNVAIPLAPVNSVSRDEPVSLYYQIRSDHDRADLHVTVALYRVKDGATADSAAFQVEFDQGVHKGINEIAPTVDVSRLDKGSYQLEVRLTDRAGAIVSRRRTALDLN